MGQVIYDTVRQEKYRPVSDPIPYCQNQFDRLTYAPNPAPAFSDEPPTTNGIFTPYIELVKNAQYEVVYATMWYDEDQNNDSPGFVIAQAVTDLYYQLKADPSRYPRGLTVRVLLGNPPSFALFPTFNNQVRLALEDFRAAGLPEMRNDEIGWNLEIGNYVGSWPHSHTKLMVVDGKTAIGAGYNLQYAHYPKDHPSGLGKDKVDLGLQMTGPVAQSTLRVFDDVWEGSVKVYCSDLDPDSSFWWMLSCSVEPAVGDHVPEVLQFYLPNADNADSHAFSLNRTQAFREADEAYFNMLASAQSSIDVIQVNFTLEIVCDLGVFLEVCNFNNHIDPLGGIMQAVDKNNAHVRILVKESPVDGIENKIAIDVLQKELSARGLSDLVEIRFFNGDLTHAKASLIDREWLVVGSQNFHYSAWGDQALTEYNLVTDDPDAATEFENFFNYLWKDAIPVE
jgi:phosphatidylserine/phosphatidylglycerophosphate/cardiolipin synthase-like enzyme